MKNFKFGKNEKYMPNLCIKVLVQVGGTCMINTATRCTGSWNTAQTATGKAVSVEQDGTKPIKYAQMQTLCWQPFIINMKTVNSLYSV